MTSLERNKHARRANRAHRTLIVAALVAGTSSCTDSPPPLVVVDQPAPDAPKQQSHKTHRPVQPSLRPSPSVSPPAFHPADLDHVRHGEWQKLGVLDATAYCYTGSRTASGVWPEPGMVATLQPIPFGTRLRLAGIGVYTVTDRIGWGSDVDVYFPSCADARAFGRHHVTVWREAA